MVLYYPQVKALVQSTRGLVASSANNWDIFTGPGYVSQANGGGSTFGSLSYLDVWANSMKIEYAPNGIELGDRGSTGGTGHCGMATNNSNYVVDLTKDFTLYWVMKVYGSTTNANQATMVGFYNAPIGTLLTTSGYPPAPIPKYTNNFGITIGAWYMRRRYNTHGFYYRTSSTDTSFTSTGATNVQNNFAYTDHMTNAYIYDWVVHEYRYTHSNTTFEYHQHKHFSGSSTFAGTNTVGDPISDYYLTSSHKYDFVLPTGGWNVPSSINLTAANVYISTMNPSSSGNQRIIPRFGIIQS